MPKILIVEDDINLREIYAASLSAEGYDLITASDGEEALTKAVAEKPSLILLDVMMRKISGFDVLDILRSTPETKDTIVVMLSALSQQSDRERGESLGANKYLVKSQITLEDVVGTVKEMLNDEGDAEDPAQIQTNGGGRLQQDDDGKNPEDPDDNDQEQMNDRKQNTIEPKQQQQQGQTGQDSDINAAKTKEDGGNTSKNNQTASEIDHIDLAMKQSQSQSDDQQNKTG